MEEEKPKRKRSRKSRYMTGEDIDMFHERQQSERDKNNKSICDTDIDGA